MATRLKLRVLPKFMAAIFDGLGTVVRKDGLATYVDLNTSKFSLAVSYDPSAQQIMIQSTVDGSWQLATVSQILTSSQTQQIKTAAGDVNVALNDGLIIINKTVGGATTVNLPASSSKVGAVKVVDWKGDAGTNNITVALVGSDKLNGNLTTWTIASDGGSVVLTPISTGIGYTV